MEPTTDLLDLSAVNVTALEGALAENPAAEAPRAELERRAAIDGEPGTDARAALNRLDEARPPVDAAFTAAAMDDRDEGTGASMARQALEADPEPARRFRAEANARGTDLSEVGRIVAAYHNRRRRLNALEVKDTQAARTAKLELELGEAVEALDAIETVLEEA